MSFLLWYLFTYFLMFQINSLLNQIDKTKCWIGPKVYMCPKKFRPQFEASYLQMFNSYYKIDNIFKKRRLVELFWYQVWPPFAIFLHNNTSNNNWLYTTQYYEFSLSGHQVCKGV